MNQSIGGIDHKADGCGNSRVSGDGPTRPDVGSRVVRAAPIRGAINVTAGQLEDGCGGDDPVITALKGVHNAFRTLERDLEDRSTSGPLGKSARTAAAVFGRSIKTPVLPDDQWRRRVCAVAATVDSALRIWWFMLGICRPAS
jgi:hypothetical protein